MKSVLPARNNRGGFTLVELLVVFGILAILAALSYSSYLAAMDSARASVSSSNLRELANANLTYAADNNGFYCPAQDPTNRIRWHGSRSSSSGTFDATKGYLSPYLGREGRVKICPLFAHMTSSSTFEDGSGGYGYNETYIGGTPKDTYQPISVLRVKNPPQTVMFTTCAFAKADGLQEYPFSEPPQWVDPNGNLSGSLQPSVHFRAHGKALVAWCDGHVSAESPTQLGGTDYYGGDSKKNQIGWFGPAENNGYWNPDYAGP